MNILDFNSYQHVERFGTDEVLDINKGKTYVFPKLDGTNAQVWYTPNDKVHCGSRNRTITPEDDNAGFAKYVESNENIIKYLRKHPNHRLYGEWLIPNHLRTYEKEAWRKFYVFDVVEVTATEYTDYENSTLIDSVKNRYLHYNEYMPLLVECGIDFIPLMAFLEDATEEDYRKLADENTYLIREGEGTGEGIVIKNYDFVNKYGRVTWAKIVIKDSRTPPKRSIMDIDCLEQQIVDKFCTEAFIEKEFAKFSYDKVWQPQYIPMLLGIIYNEFIKEETWNIIKKFKNPIINFKVLQTLVTYKIKQVLSHLF